MLVNLSLLAGVLAASSAAAAGGPMHHARAGRPHAGRSAIQPRRIERRVVKSSSCVASSTSSAAAASATATAGGLNGIGGLVTSVLGVATSVVGGVASEAVGLVSSVVIGGSEPMTSAVVSSSAAASKTSSSAAAATSTSAATSSGEKLVAAHHMVGNTYSYSQSMWASDIAQAAANGINAFALNVGTDSWQIAQVASAYAAAAAYGSSFKLFLSLDMTVFPCSSAGNADALVSIAATYAGHSNQATWQSTGKPIVSTFAGSDCTFGQSDWVSGWQTAVKTPFASRAGIEMFFLPSVFADTSTFASASVMDGELNWNSAWASGDSEATWWSDETYISALGDKAYMAAVSPVFFTHYGADSYNKNWIFKSDNFMFASRWKTLVEQRLRVDAVEVLTWNDYGESSYIGPIQGDQPNSQAWVDGFDHQALLAINKYYATAYKTGSYPAITQDVIYLSARPHAKAATASADNVGRPTGGQNGDSNGYLWVDDEFYALVFAVADGEVTLTSGSSSGTYAVTAGVNWLAQTLEVGAGMTATFNDVSLTPDFTFSGSPKTYNWNYLFASSS